MVVPFEQAIVNWLLLGGMVAVLFSLRHLVVLERRLIALELSIQRMVYKVELDERRLLAEQRLRDRKVLKASRGKK